jgi:RHS repeat-associated protein
LFDERPHLLVETDNNLGAVTSVQYTPSTRYYLDDLREGRPWITHLPIPVHCVSKVTVTDKWRRTTFSSTYSYHHGCFDGAEREFRGFGRIEQIDVEDYGTFRRGNATSPFITDDLTLYQPPVKTVTWYHTGAPADEHVLGQLSDEYFPAVFDVDGPFREKPLPEPELPAGLDAGERREAFRACKGVMLRQEVYELGVEHLEADPPTHIPVRLFSVAARTCAIRCLQRRGDNPHAVFLVTGAEELIYQHDLVLSAVGGSGPVTPDPRITHSLRLRHDEHGNLQQGVVVNYPRIGGSGASRPADLPADPSRDGLFAAIQAEPHIAYTETRYTSDVIIRAKDPPGAVGAVKHHRLRQPCEVRTYELTGLTAIQASGVGPYADLAALRRHQLCEDATYPATVPAGQASVAVVTLAYHEQPVSGGAQRRIVERVRTLYFDDGDGVPAPVAPLRFGSHGPRGLKYEVYKLALTDELLHAVFWRRDASGQPVEDLLAWPVDGTTTVRDLLDDAAASGYVHGASLDASLAGQRWIRSGTAGFAAGAAATFYLPSHFTDAFGNTTTVEYDPAGLLPVASRDALGNETRREHLDYRVLAPRVLLDVNGNRTEVAFDIRGQVVALASKGKQVGGAWQGANLTGFDFATANPPVNEVVAFCSGVQADIVKARRWLGGASTRFVYCFGEALDAQGNPVWASSMAGACAITSERHAGQLPPGTVSPVQLQLECSDGTGAVLMHKAQAEPDAERVAAGAAARQRWIVNGLTVRNNKGKPVKQYEPAFSDRFGFEPPAAEGVTGITYYDAAGRTVRTEDPDGTLSRVEFSPWHVTSFDENDTVLESAWYQARNQYPPADTLPVGLAGIITATPEQRAGWLTARHAGTPSITVLDSLGREVVSITHNRVEDSGGVLTFGGRQWSDEFAVSYTKLDGEGKALWVRDALGNIVEQHLIPIKPARLAGSAPDTVPAGSGPCYDIAGNLLFTHSMDSGDRWMLADATGKQLVIWDVNAWEPTAGPASAAVTDRRLIYTIYDALHRPMERWLRIDGGVRALVESFEYRDTAQLSPAALADNRRRNLVGKAATHWDVSGRATIERISFDGETEAVTRTLVADPRLDVVDWNVSDRNALLAAETFEHVVEYDALGRPTTILNWHRGPGSRVAVYEPRYNERGLLAGEDLVVGATRTATAIGRLGGTRTAAIRSVTYDAKGQRLAVALGNGTTTRYTYSPDTFRLVHLYTRRGPGFAGDCGGDPDAASPARPCGVQNLHYTYDPVGNVTHVQDDAQDTVWFAGQQVEPSSDYTYDALYRLTEATGRENAAGIGAPTQREGPWPQVAFPSAAATRRYTQRYAYDAVGNLRTTRHMATALPGQPGAGSWTRNYAYDYQDPARPASNRLYRTWLGRTSWDSTAPARRTEYRHDAHGNMRNLGSTPSSQDLRWDWRDLLRSLDLQGGGRAFYDYDVDAERTRKRIERIGGNVEERIHLDGFEWFRRWVGGAVVEEIETLHLFEGDTRMLLVDDVLKAPPGSAGVRTLFRYQYRDLAASVSAELDETAQLISREEYHPYGTSAYRAANSAIEAPKKRYRYTGMERDEESGLSRHGARYLSCTLGRWLSPDPAGIADGLNRYRYARCNPIANSDRGGGQTIGVQRGLAALNRRDIAEKQRLLSHMAHHPEQYPTVTEETKRALRAEISALERSAGKLEAEASEREDFHRNVGLPVVAAAAAIAAAPAKTVTLSVLGVGALLGAAFGAGRQIAEKIDDPRKQFSHLEVLSSAGWGGALAPATIAYGPVRFLMALSGVASGLSEWDKGHQATAVFDIATSVLPEVYHQTKAAAAKPGGLAARLNPKNYTVDPNTAGMSGGVIQFKPPAASAAKYHSAAYETTLDPSVWGRARSVHFNRANAALDAALAADPEFAAEMEKIIPGLRQAVSPQGGGRRTPAGWTWEHASSTTAGGRSGVMRLVPRPEHTPGSPFWRTLHPDPGAAGGYAEWAIPAGAPANR